MKNVLVDVGGITLDRPSSLKAVNDDLKSQPKTFWKYVSEFGCGKGAGGGGGVSTCLHHDVDGTLFS
jgi:hypothetical protein